MMIDSIDDTLSYNEILDIMIKLNISKIKLIKTQMNNLINILNHIQQFNNLPPYLDYTLYMLVKSFPILNKYISDIIKILLLVDNYNIHPSIFLSLYANIIFSIYINELTLDDTLINDRIFIESISIIYKEIEILMSIFDDIFIIVDNEYLDSENKLYYNYINSLSHIEFNQYISTVDYSKNKIIILNIFIIEIEHLTQNIINESFNINDNLLKNNLSVNKLISDLKLFENISTEFNNQINANYNYNIKYEKYKELKLNNILEFEEKNSIYIWIDQIALINSKILETLLK